MQFKRMERTFFHGYPLRSFSCGDPGHLIADRYAFRIPAMTPSTNPTSTVMYKILIAVKARNAIVVAPHPAAVKCCVETARLMAEAGKLEFQQT